MVEVVRNQSSNPISRYQAYSHLLGEGANASVFLGRDIYSNEKVALKFTDYSNLPIETIQQLENEAHILQKISKLPKHDEFLHFKDLVQQDGEVCFVTEYVEGGTFVDYCKPYPNSTIPERIAKWPFLKLLKAIERLHKENICHRDLKLENIMYNKETHKLKIIDFGFAAETKKDGIAIKHKDACGSVHYVAPEIVSRNDYDGKLADVWSLGVILFVLLAGCFPFNDIENRPEIIFDKIVAGEFFMPSWLSSDVQTLLSSMLQCDPKKRPKVSDLINHPWFSKHY
mmetsp:Transcript_8765/g.14781  ORF Transcript_8765/g.14781 Transcript_8765/m.14781 type:complete len:285 (+) Transcript_8765:26-880(+)